MMLLAPLSKEGGGLGLCRVRKEDGTLGEPAKVFADREDPGYQTILAMAEAGKRRLDRVTRFDMPNFRPDPAYLREMRRYGVLKGDFEGMTVYDLDQRYWRSLGYHPKSPSTPGFLDSR